MRIRSRHVGVPLLGLTLALPLASTSGAQPAAPPGTVLATAAVAPTSSAHPYSDPVWYPARDVVQVGCGHSNPGCSDPHNFWTQILTPLGQKPGTTSTAKVHAMGAGIAHIGEANGVACGSGDASYGTWVWVDHGGGTTSRYGHLSTILIREGQRVAPGTALGIMGTSGKRGKDACFRSYLDFQLKAKGPRGTAYEFPVLFACRGDAAEIWPIAVTGHPTWNDTPQGTALPAADDSCLPTTVPATADKPDGVTLKNTKGDKLKARWEKAPAGVDKVRLEFAKYHPSTKTWDAQHRSVWNDVKVSSTSKTYKVIDNRKYRVRVWFHTRGAGWSVGSAWVKKTVR